MARYIDADLLHIKMEDLYEHHIEMRNYSADGAVADCLDMLDNTPTADVVEVVRCKDCAYYMEMNGYEYNGHKARCCMRHSDLRSENAYCSEGIRRTT